MGIKHLRSYLDLAEHGTGALPYDGRRTIAVDLHREEIADALRDRGYAVATDVGLSDFKVDISLASLDAPDRPFMAILLDSPAWAARRTAGDRDGLPGDVLTRMMRWPSVQRVWLPAWISDREAVLDKLEKAFVEAGSGLSDADPEPVRSAGSEGLIAGPAVSIPGVALSSPLPAASSAVPFGTPSPVLAAAGRVRACGTCY